MKTYIRNINKNNIKNINLDKYKKYDLSIYNNFLYLGAGEEHYQLLANISEEFTNKVFFDVGTNYGASAIALANNKSNKVISYDIKDLLTCKIEESNIEFCIGDVTRDPRLLTSDLIFLDTYHDGYFEKIFLDYLVQNKYKGVVMMDDVNSWPVLRQIATKIAQDNNLEIVDLTNLGHSTGTLCIFFS